MQEFLPNEVSEIIATTPALRGAYAVGGCVRDWLLGNQSTDFDIEVFGVSYAELVRALSPFGRTDLVGRSFGVVKLGTRSGLTVDFSIPRRDSKTTPGHKGFEIEFDPGIAPREAAARRDFTINSLMFDPRTNQLLDYFGGEADLRARVLKHTSAAFVEDPLRVLRGMQFASRFDLIPAPETVDICRRMTPNFGELARERVRDEWFKWAGKSRVPSRGLKFLATTGWIEHFPELDALRSTPQDPEWHPEGDVFVHTCHCCDALVDLPGWRDADFESRVVLSLATLAHDFGKPSTTHRGRKKGRFRIISPGHEEAGGPVAEQFLNRIHAPRSVSDRVVPLVRNHLAHLRPATDRSVRRLARRLEPENIRNLCLVMTADHFGRPPEPKVPPPGISELLKKAVELEIQSNALRPILRGRDLVAIGMEPHPEFRLILSESYECQLDGTIRNLGDAYRWLMEQPFSLLSDRVKARLREKIDSLD